MSTVQAIDQPGAPDPANKPLWKRLGEAAFRPLFLLLVVQAIGHDWPVDTVVDRCVAARVAAQPGVVARS
jgi:hypothetical protein